MIRMIYDELFHQILNDIQIVWFTPVYLNFKPKLDFWSKCFQIQLNRRFCWAYD